MSDIHSLNAVVACCDKIEDDNLQLFPVARTTNETFGILKYVVGQREQIRYSHHKRHIYDLCSYLITFFLCVVYLPYCIPAWFSSIIQQKREESNI